MLYTSLSLVFIHRLRAQLIGRMCKTVSHIDTRLGDPPVGAFSSLFMYGFMYVSVLVLVPGDNCCAHTAYSRHDSLGIGPHSERNISAEYLGEHGAPQDIARTTGDRRFTVPDLKRKRRRRDRKQRGEPQGRTVSEDEERAHYKGKIKDCFWSNDSRRVWQESST